jgi:hypothetical protein
MKKVVCFFIICITARDLYAQKESGPTVENKKGWWLTEPVSLIQTNLRETDFRS